MVTSPIESLYQFTVTDQVLREFSVCVEDNLNRYIDRTFKSLDILESIGPLGREIPV